MKIKGTLNQKGFSLVELMIVVAIIGLLAAVGIPQYAKFQARARQGEAKAALAALYTAEQSFAGEWNCFVSDLRNIGFGVTGTNLRYIVGFATHAAAVPANPAGCSAGAPPVNAAGFAQSGEPTLISPGATWSIAKATVAADLTAANGVVIPTAVAFTALASGDPKNTVNNGTVGGLDRWTINQGKAMSNTRIGF